MKLKAKRACKFEFQGTVYRCEPESIIEVDIPEDRVDTHSFEILEQKKDKKVKKEVKENDE